MIKFYIFCILVTAYAEMSVLYFIYYFYLLDMFFKNLLLISDNKYMWMKRFWYWNTVNKRCLGKPFLVVDNILIYFSWLKFTKPRGPSFITQNFLYILWSSICFQQSQSTVGAGNAIKKFGSSQIRSASVPQYSKK